MNPLFLTKEQSAYADEHGLMALNSLDKEKSCEIDPRPCMLCGGMHFNDGQALCRACTDTKVLS